MKKLYFVAGLPTEAELEEAEREGALIRNALAWHEGDCMEICECVMGRPENVPAPYRHLWLDVQESYASEKPAKKSKKQKEDRNATR